MNDFRELVEQIMANHPVEEVAVSNVDGDTSWTLAHLMQSPIIESDHAILVEHPTLGTGTLLGVDALGVSAEIDWDRTGSWVTGNSQVTLKEAQRIIVLDAPKYTHDQDLSEETDMTKIDMTSAEYEMLFEDSYTNVPAPSDTILTGAEAPNDGESSPLSSMDGDGGSTTEPYEENGSPSDAPSTPSIASMDDPARKAKTAKGGGGGGSNQFKKKASNKSDEKSSDETESNEDDDMKNESFTFEDADLETVVEYDDMDEGEYMEHDMEAGEIAVTKEFLEKLLTAAVDAQLDASKIGMVGEAVASCCDEDRTLDVADIGMVMGKLRDMIGGGAEDAAGDDFDGPEEDAALMGAEDDVEECGDEYMDEGSEESRQKGRQKRQNYKMDKTRQHDDGGNKPKYRKPRAERPVEEGELPDALKKHQIKKGSDADNDDKVNENRKARRGGKQKLDEAWMMSVPNVGNPREKGRFEGMTEEEIEMSEIKRLAGM